MGIGGVFAAAVTPRRKGGTEIDLAAAFEVIDFLCTRKVDGIVLMGSTGEFLHYTVEDRIRLSDLGIKRSRVPVIVNVSHSSLEGAIDLGRAASRSGAAALLLKPPYFFPYTQADILAFCREFARETDPRTPRFLYHIPQFTSPIEPETAAALLRDGDWQGIKDSSGNQEYYEAMVKLQTESPFTLMLGSESIYSREMGRGAAGMISGVASAVPELLVALKRTIHAGPAELKSRLETRLGQFVAWLDRMPVPVGVREAAAARGLRVGPHACPAGPEQVTTFREFRHWFSEWLPEVERECAHT